MTTITVPAKVGAVPELEVRPASVTSDQALRLAGAQLNDAAAWGFQARRPAGWSGDAADTAAASVTRFATRSETAATAVAEASDAVAAYLVTLTELSTRRTTLVQDRTAVNGAVDQLELDIAASGESDATGLQDRADKLDARATLLTGQIATWSREVTSAEDTLIAVLTGADTVGEVQAQLRGVDVHALEQQLTARRGDPKALAAWWASLTAAQREALTIADPALVGNSGGLPAEDRDAGNRISLDADITDLQYLRDHGGLTPEQQRLLTNALATQQAIANGETTPDALRGNQPVEVYLLQYQPAAFGGDGAAAIAYGNPDTATNTAVIVPGFTNDMTHMPGQGQDALNLFGQAQKNGESASVISWMGYDAPSGSPSFSLHGLSEIGDLSGVLQEGKAEAGGHELSQFVDGLRASDSGSQSHLTVIGHSYGSTTVAHAGADGLDENDMVLVGSPGAGGGVTNVSQLGAPAGHVFVGSAENDPVTWLGRDGSVGLGHNPSQADFGATRFPVNDGPSFHLDQVGSVGFATHGSYFDPTSNSTSLDNIAKIVDGQPPDTIPGRTESANDHLLNWAKNEAGYQVKHEAGTVWNDIKSGIGSLVP